MRQIRHSPVWSKENRHTEARSALPRTTSEFSPVNIRPTLAPYAKGVNPTNVATCTASSSPQRGEQMLQAVVVYGLHQCQQTPQFAMGKPFTGKPVEVVPGQVRKYPALVLAIRHLHAYQFQQQLWPQFDRRCHVAGLVKQRAVRRPRRARPLGRQRQSPHPVAWEPTGRQD